MQVGDDDDEDRVADFIGGVSLTHRHKTHTHKHTQRPHHPKAEAKYSDHNGAVRLICMTAIFFSRRHTSLSSMSPV